MSKFVVINPDTGCPYHCQCHRCLTRARLTLMNPRVFGRKRLPSFCPGDLLDFNKMLWPDELAKKFKEEKGEKSE